jgi:AraC-like DNA-binding protein
MRYAEYRPSLRFARFVDAYWILEGEGTGLPDAILPDGRLEIIFHYGATFRHHHADGTIERQLRSLLAGQALAPIVLSHHGCAGVAAIRLRPAAAGAVLRFPVSETTGRIQDLGAVFPSARALRDRLGDARDDKERIEGLESWLDERALEDPRPEVEAAVAVIVQTGGRADIATLASRAGIGMRRLERRFVEDVGLTPKRFARIIRLQRALRLVRSGDALASVALACGYYDQSHMVLDFQRLAAVSPRAWREHAGVLAPLFAGCDTEPNPTC